MDLFLHEESGIKIFIMENYKISTLKIRNILSDLKSGIINPSPAWQRGDVWTTTLRHNLIETIMKNMPIPQLTFWQRPNGTSVVVDGRQRITTLQMYEIGDIPSGKSKLKKYEELSEDEQRSFGNKNIQVLEFSSDVEEEEIIDYFQRINAGGKTLTHGELINSHQSSPVITAIYSTFFTPESSFLENEWKLLFPEVNRSTKRMSHIENTVPYLTSSLRGVKYLTKSYPIIHQIISSATQEEVDNHLPTFIFQLKKLLEILGTIEEQNSSWIDSHSWSGGLPLIRQIAPIWYSIIDNEIIPKEKSLPEFWSEFYKLLELEEEKKNVWETHLRKNSKPSQLKKEIDFAINIIY